MQMLFLHGAGGFQEDRELAERLTGAVGAELQMPECPDEDMSFEAWASVVRPAVGSLGADDLVVGHSFGGSILLGVLAEAAPEVRRGLVLAAPDWGVSGWDVAEYAPSGPPQGVRLSLHHCRDDEVVPVAHFAALAESVPGAAARVHPIGGHQFAGLEGDLMREMTR
ncbi:alpha/beta hydrolase [Kytococcus sedentarius]|uniref:Predicted esterase of the alpha/beta hydrolase fold family n=1 Tax=Kytococcus sedentarius (strain ATCC 14392 / DSM 20547 / JCM 11482 / CCUG 33030 / NBRC 15357 / NCTC 11040 / CCM 314 / 541) TaxID=478801 RepID=C7NJF7_KYTSD|nr:alpha/beta hydrolase [Kytococcus sedentarius]ACV05287.1 predicted esterase of the alpha/beta hydrolase fold family [Kytococcus sedentarius DSM 20547]QQB63740.1 alpha/beta hydrolase [Kytococcus sedentarius]STX13305.1 Predicted esterase of the alpha/beta hydrolase fold [Kytococcus sedentarius]